MVTSSSGNAEVECFNDTDGSIEVTSCKSTANVRNNDNLTGLSSHDRHLSCPIPRH